MVNGFRLGFFVRELAAEASFRATGVRELKLAAALRSSRFQFIVTHRTSHGCGRFFKNKRKLADVPQPAANGNASARERVSSLTAGLATFESRSYA